MLAWRHSGFSVHNRVRVAAYMLRAPFSLEKTTYDAASGTVLYRSRLHATLKRNFQVMTGADWLALLCKHIPDWHEHMERCYGRYSSRTTKLIRKVYDVDPLPCPKCGAQMRVIALVEDPAVIERILSSLGLWESPRAGGPSPRAASADRCSTFVR